MIRNGTTYNDNTPDEVVDIINRYMGTDNRIRVFYGDVETGRDWGEENAVMGTVGSSSGHPKVPLMISRRGSLCGGAILAHCIVKIIDIGTRRTLYENPNYQYPVYRVDDCQVYRGDQLVAMFKSPARAHKYTFFMLGARFSY